MQPDDTELRRGHEAGGDGAALEARRQPLGISRVALGPAAQVLDLDTEDSAKIIERRGGWNQCGVP
jgi:hypothetical protein